MNISRFLYRSDSPQAKWHLISSKKKHCMRIALQVVEQLKTLGCYKIKNYF